MLALMEPTQSADRVISPKRALRQAVLARLRAPDEADAVAAAAAVMTLPETRGSGCVAAYASLAHEIGTRPLLDGLRAAGVVVLLPILRADRGLDWAPYAGWDALVPGALGTRQPSAGHAALSDASVVVVPAVAVDATGRRLGRGGGSYDRALAVRAPAATVVALVADGAVVGEVPVESHDVPVDVVVTPTRVIRCSNRAPGTGV